MDRGQEKQVLHAGRHVRFVRRGTWEYVERAGVDGIVGIVAVTRGGELILIEQHRPPLNAMTIEIPAGLVGDEPDHRGEAMETAVRRELFEETGYEAGRVRRLCRGAPSAGITDEMIDLFLATELRRVGPGGGDASEDIVVHAVPVGEVEQWLKDRARAGAVIDLKVYAALFFAGEWMRSGGA